MGIVVTHPAVFVRVASKGLTGYGTWKSGQQAENRGFAKAVFAQKCLMRGETRGEEMPHPRVFLQKSSKSLEKK